ncbi:MAG: phosphate ABC transporter permease subunit PstC [Alphaproteobacteria bacterium]
MSPIFLTAVVLALCALAYGLGRGRAMALRADHRLPALPSHFGSYVALWCGLPAALLLGLWLIGEPQIVGMLVTGALPADAQALAPGRLSLVLDEVGRIAAGSRTASDTSLQAAVDRYLSLQRLSGLAMTVVVLAAAITGLVQGRRRVSPRLRARDRVERVIKIAIMAASTMAILATLGIVASLLFETIRFFQHVSPFAFFTGLSWSPQTAVRADQVGSSGAFGAIPVFAGTALITVIAMVVAVPIGLMAAIYTAEYASPRTRAVVKPLLEVLAGIPTVVYGFFAALTVGPLFRGLGEALGLTVSSESALAAGVVMGVMIIPFVSSLSDDVINAVPQTLRDGAYALGSTKSETIIRVVLPASLHGIVGAVLLAVSRAIGETMIVVMAAGLAANLSANPLQATTTVTVQIATLLVGDQEFDSAKTLAAFALAMVLFTVTLGLNMVAFRVVKKYREAYE